MTDPAAADSFDIDSLCTLTGVPRRTVRYYIQIGLLERPEGETRAARYGRRHLAQLLEIQKWTAAGLSLDRIRELLAGGAEPPVSAMRTGTIEVRSHLLVADGVEIVVEPGRAGLSPAQMRAFFRGVADLHRQLTRAAPAAPVPSAAAEATETPPTPGPSAKGERP